MGDHTLLYLIKKGTTQEELEEFLDRMDHESRLHEIYSLTPEAQAKLYQMAKVGVNENDLIPKDFPANREVIFYGLNTLPLFRKFQKRMCRSENGKTIWGYNFQKLKWFTGPGYFVVDEKTDRPGEVMLDYTRTPDRNPESWPKLKSNETGVSKLVYGGMKDYLRRVSSHVFIGEATKDNKGMNQYFILCRDESVDKEKLRGTSLKG